MTPPVAKRHHFVPQFYLRGFADDAERITTVTLPGEQRYTQVIRKTAAENGFYAVPGHPDGSDAFEKILSQVEGEAASILARIKAGQWPLSPKDRASLAYYLALQVTRGPEQRRNMDRLAAHFTRIEIGYGGKAGVKGWVKEQYGVDISDAEAEELWAQATQPGGPPIRHTALAHIQQMMELVDTIHPSLSFRPWMLVRFDEASLITSDTPVSLIARQDDGPAMGVGFLTAQHILVPLSRKLGLAMTDPEMSIDLGIPVEKVRAGECDFAEDGSAGIADFFNTVTARQASLRLYHHPDDDGAVPDDLPNPRPVTMSLSGGSQEFTGEPLLAPSVEGDAGHKRL